jgi:hypothetical protein
MRIDLDRPPFTLIPQEPTEIVTRPHGKALHGFLCDDRFARLATRCAVWITVPVFILCNHLISTTNAQK